MIDSLQNQKFQLNVGSSGLDRALSAVDGSLSVKTASADETGNDTISLTLEGRAAATGMKAVNALGADGSYFMSKVGSKRDESTAEGVKAKEEEDTKTARQKLREEQIQKLEEQIQKLQEEIAELEKQPDSEAKKQALDSKRNEMSLLQSQISELTEQNKKEAGGGGDLYSALSAKGGITSPS